MLPKRNLLESLSIICASGLFICIFLHFVTNISPLTGVWFPLYLLVLVIASLWCSLRFLQWLLHQNKPLKYDLDAVVRKYPYLAKFIILLPVSVRRNKVRKSCYVERAEYDTSELSVISSVLERKLVSSWYVPHISSEIGFPFACKQLLDHAIGRAFQICSKIDTKSVYIDVCAILISHLKEYRRAIKRQDKNPGTSIESHYRKTHPVFDTNKPRATADYCTDVLRALSRPLLTWDLRDTPHSELLIRILSKKLDSFIMTTLADPVWLNSKLLSVLLDKTDAAEDKQEEYQQSNEICYEEPYNNEYVLEYNGKMQNELEPELSKVEVTSIESALSTFITQSTAPILQRDIGDELATEASSFDNVNVDGVNGKGVLVSDLTRSAPVEIQGSPVMRQRRGRQGNQVKIYDRIIEGSVKTWETDMDLQCISVGHDLLASLDGEITLSRLWGHEAESDGSPNPPKNKSPPALWFGEEDTIDMDGAAIPAANFGGGAAPGCSQTRVGLPVSGGTTAGIPAPGGSPGRLLQDLSCSVHQAKAKIGDLQDEAAGMMEGLLDFGIAGLKKGLRFTGLSDESQEKEKSPPYHREKREGSSSPPESGSTKSTSHEDKDIDTSSLLHKDDASVPPLVKLHRVASQDSMPVAVPCCPSIDPSSSDPHAVLWADSALECDEIEPQYEDAGDLSTSIARLRELLNQQISLSEHQSAGGETPAPIWCTAAEETRGRTHTSRSSRRVESAALADEYDMNVEQAAASPEHNNMQRLDKLLQRTVTGVFNSLRGAVGGDGGGGGGIAAEGCAGEGGVGAEASPSDYWAHVCTPIETSCGGAVARLVGARRAHAHMQHALTDTHPHAHSAAHLNAQAAPPSDDFEEWCIGPWLCWSGASETAAALGLARTHVTQRLFALLFADLIEPLISTWLQELTCWLRTHTFEQFEAMSKQDTHTRKTRDAKLPRYCIDDTCRAVIDKLPMFLLNTYQCFCDDIITFPEGNDNLNIICRIGQVKLIRRLIAEDKPILKAIILLFGLDEVQSSVQLLLQSISTVGVNTDVALRLLDVFAAHMATAARIHSHIDT